MNYMEMSKQRKEALDAADAILKKAESEKRPLAAEETAQFDAHVAEAAKLGPQLETIRAKNTLLTAFGNNPIALTDVGNPNPNPGEPQRVLTPEEGRVRAAHHSAKFSAWVKRAVGNLTNLSPEMEATNPSGVISVGSGSGLDSVGFAVPTQILPFMKSYFAFSPFETAGSSIVSTDHMRNINVPVVAAGAPPSSYAEGQGPSSSGSSFSQPFGLSGFTMGANKRSRQVVASWESLQSTEVPMQPIIIDELLAAIANALTSDATTALYNALTAPPNVSLLSGSSVLPPPLQVGGSGVTADNYGQMTALRNSLVAGYEDPAECSWMLSRNTLAIIRNTRADSSGVVMFDANSDTILGRKYVVNEYFDSICGAGFVAYGNWRRGAWLRRTPLITRVLQELFWANSEIDFIVTSWADNHFLAELVGAAQPPSFQPIYFTKLPSGSLS
jgi:HK97 family phage major capsid protein